MKFYTSATQTKTHIIERGYENGKRFQKEVEYQPYLFEKCQYSTGWTTAWNEPVKRIDFSSMEEFKAHLRDNKTSKSLCGFENLKYLYLNDEYADIDYDRETIGVFNLDIEVESDDGFPHPDVAEKIVNAIAISCRGEEIVLGLEAYTGKDNTFKYIHCKTEGELLKQFVYLINKFDPDIFTGWNIRGFDFPYLYNRIFKILGQKAVDAMSPLGVVKKRKVKGNFGKEEEVVDIEGIAMLDYMEVYKKFNFSPRESFKLDHIAFVELGENKLDYGEATSLYELYKTDWNRYIDYNIQDVRIVDRLDDKLDYISMALAVAYKAKVNYREVLGTVGLWDALIHNDLHKRNMVVPAKKVTSKGFSPAGGYVREPVVGMHDWVVSFDLNSLYPSLIRQFNISPEKHRGTVPAFPSVDDIIGNDAHLDYTKSAISKNVSLTAAGEVYLNDSEGFLGRIMRELYDGRVEVKNEMKALKAESKTNKSKELKNTIDKLNAVQHSLKILLNSGYGALGNQYFRWFDNRHVEAVTLSGQMAVRRVEKAINECLLKTYNKELHNSREQLVIYMDTDSCYITLNDIIKRVMPNGTATEIVDYINDKIVPIVEQAIDETYEEMAKETNSFENVMVMKRESIASRGLWTAKKRYALHVWDDEGFRYDEPKLKATGLASVRSSTPTYARGAIAETLNVMMTQDEGAVQNKVAEVRKSFETLPIVDIAFPRGVSNIMKYQINRSDGSFYYTDKRCPIHVKASIIFNKILYDKGDTNTPHITAGDKLKYVYMIEPNPIGEPVLGFPAYFPEDTNLEPYVDRIKQFEKGYLKPINDLLDPIGWSHEPKATVDSLF